MGQPSQLAAFCSANQCQPAVTQVKEAGAVKPRVFERSAVPSNVFEYFPRSIDVISADSNIDTMASITTSSSLIICSSYDFRYPALISPAVAITSPALIPVSTVTTTSDIDINAIAQEINSTLGIEPVQVIDVGEFKALAMPPDVDLWFIR